MAGIGSVLILLLVVLVIFMVAGRPSQASRQTHGQRGFIALAALIVMFLTALVVMRSQ